MHAPTKEELKKEFDEGLQDTLRLSTSVMEGERWNKKLSKILLQFVNALLMIMGVILLIACFAAVSNGDWAGQWVVSVAIVVALLIIMQGALGAYGTKKANDSMLTKYFLVMTVWLLFLLMMVLLAISFSSLAKQTVSNFEDKCKDAESDPDTYGVEDTEEDAQLRCINSAQDTVSREMMALGLLTTFAIGLIMVAQYCVLDLVGLELLAPPLLKLLNGLAAVFGLLLCCLGGTAGASEGSAAAWMIMLGGICMFGLSALGFKAGQREDPKLRLVYFGVLVFMLFMVEMCGLAALAFSEKIRASAKAVNGGEEMTFISGNTTLSEDDLLYKQGTMKAAGSMAMVVVMFLCICLVCVWRLLQKEVVARLLLAFATVALGFCGFVTLAVASRVVDLTKSAALSHLPADDELFLQAAKGMVVVGLFTFLLSFLSALTAWKQKLGLLNIYITAQTALGIMSLMFCTLVFAGKVGMEKCLTTLLIKETVECEHIEKACLNCMAGVQEDGCNEIGDDTQYGKTGEQKTGAQLKTDLGEMDDLVKHMAELIGVIGVFAMVTLTFIVIGLFAASSLKATLGPSLGMASSDSVQAPNMESGVPPATEEEMKPKKEEADSEEEQEKTEEGPGEEEKV